MKALIVYESMYGNTHAVADAVAEGLGAQVAVDVRPVHSVPTVPADLDLLIVGAPTHMHGLSTAMSRNMAVTAAEEDAGKVAPGATEEPGLREWLRDLDAPRTARAVAFDTRGDARAGRPPARRRAGSRGAFAAADSTSSTATASWWPTPRDRSRTASSSAHAPGARRSPAITGSRDRTGHRD